MEIEMSIELHTTISNVLKMPYWANQNARSGGGHHGHEDAVADEFRKFFNEESRTNYPGLNKSMLKKWAQTCDDSELCAVAGKMPNGSFILQPAGSQGFPDILVRDFNGRFIAVECKSGKNGLTPMWNDNLPMDETIYILSSGKAQATTVFMGRDVITQAERDLIKKQEEEIAAIVKKYKGLMSSVPNRNRGFIQKSRKQHFQDGGNAKTNYFDHVDRQLCESNTLDYAKQ